PLADKESIQITDLEELPLIISRQSLVENQISGWGGGDIKKLNIVATYNLIFNASLMVDEGFGYALCLDKLVYTGEKSNLCFRPLTPSLEVHLDIVWKKHQIFSKGAEKFLERLQIEFANSLNKTNL
ncbi:MAG: LysR family transcriptional regulator substrate-binding protein, partial [Fusobacteriaceae bacterium]